MTELQRLEQRVSEIKGKNPLQMQTYIEPLVDQLFRTIKDLEDRIEWLESNT